MTALCLVIEKVNLVSYYRRVGVWNIPHYHVASLKLSIILVYRLYLCIPPLSKSKSRYIVNHIKEKIDLSLRSLLYNKHNKAFDNVRIGNLYENILNSVFNKLYNMDVFIHEQLKLNIYEATEIREGKR